MYKYSVWDGTPSVAFSTCPRKVPDTKMFKLLLLAAAIPALLAETESAFSLLEKHAQLPDVQTEPVETHAVFKKESQQEVNPVYRGEEQHQGRANIEPVRPRGPVIKYDHMLADQPAKQEGTRDNRVDDLTIPNYGYVPVPQELAYPDIPYAPSYGYEPSYASSKNYDIYGNSPNSYLMEPDTSMSGLMWSQVPDSRTMVGFVGRTISWIFGNIFVLFLGTLLTVGVCSYTNICTIAFRGIGPIHEEMRALMTPEGLERIGTAADYVKVAIDKYQKIQKITDVPARRRRAVFN